MFASRLFDKVQLSSGGQVIACPHLLMPPVMLQINVLPHLWQHLYLLLFLSPAKAAGSSQTTCHSCFNAAHHITQIATYSCSKLASSAATASVLQ